MTTKARRTSKNRKPKQTSEKSKGGGYGDAKSAKANTKRKTRGRTTENVR